MRILVACEFSGIVRDAFREIGHDAVSCDLEPSERPGPHIQGDVLGILGDGWDMMIAHPPCEHLSRAGVAWWPAKRADGRQQAAIDFVMALWNAPIQYVALENPPGVLSTAFRPPDQYIQPWQFGEPYNKPTGLWLRQLPPLLPMEIVSRGAFTHRGKSAWMDSLGPRAERQKFRSRTFPGIARAMALQWGTLDLRPTGKGEG